MKERATFNKVKLYDNNIKRLIINDPNGAAGDLSIVTDSSLRYLELNLNNEYQSLDIKDNYILNSIRGQMKNFWIAPAIYDNPSLKDLCVLRDGIDAYYQNLNQRDKDNFNTSELKQNGKGASTYEEMMAIDCSWMADTFTTVAEQKVVDQSNASIYPNPISRLAGTVSISISSQKSISIIQITNLQGQRVFSISQAEGSTAQVAISDFSVGVYVVQIIDSSGGLSKKKLVIAE